jgi:holo-[acyl-carrier protein] synthase
VIAGIGVDVVEIRRIERLLDRFGEKFADRILTRFEKKAWRQRNSRVQFVASRFAAKEAASKALGTGIAQGVGFHDIEVFNDERGQPQLRFHAVADRLVAQADIRRSLLSLSDERHYCVAMVVLESDR